MSSACIVSSPHVKEAIRVAKLKRKGTPKSSRQRKMQFQRVYELHGKLKELGEYKLIVGEKKNKRVLHYCITSKRTNR